jgi:hypothetical protein
MLEKPSASVFKVGWYSTLLRPQTWMHFYQTNDALYDHNYSRKNLKYYKQRTLPSSQKHSR